MKNKAPMGCFAILLGKMQEDSIVDKFFDDFCGKLREAYRHSPTNILLMFGCLPFVGWGIGWAVVQYGFPLIKAWIG